MKRSVRAPSTTSEAAAGSAVIPATISTGSRAGSSAPLPAAPPAAMQAGSPKTAAGDASAVDAPSIVEPVYFATPDDLARWFAAHAAIAQELIVGFHKRDTGVASVTWPEAVDEALAVGWIDGVRHRIDEARYRIRFTPRKAASHWSAVNIARIAALESEGRMTPAGRAAFAARSESNSRRAAYEQSTAATLDAADEAAFRRHEAAWRYYESSPRGYRQRVTWWVVNAKQATTRQRRLAQLIAACDEGRRL